MCAIQFLQLEDFINPHNEISGMIIDLEPQGVLFVDIRLLFVSMGFTHLNLLFLINRLNP